MLQTARAVWGQCAVIEDTRCSGAVVPLLPGDAVRLSSSHGKHEGIVSEILADSVVIFTAAGTHRIAWSEAVRVERLTPVPLARVKHRRTTRVATIGALAGAGIAVARFPPRSWKVRGTSF
jgi:hypothetical protein